MKRWLSITRRTASSTSLRMAAYWALRSSSGTRIAMLVGVLMGAISSCRRAVERGLGIGPALLIEQLLLGNRFPGARRRAHHDGAGLDVTGDHRAGGDQRVGADRDPRQDDRAGADAPAAPHRHALEVLEALGGAADVVVVRGHDPRGHEHPVLERRVGGDV